MSRLSVETANLELGFAMDSPEIGVRRFSIQDQGLYTKTLPRGMFGSLEATRSDTNGLERS